MDKKIHRFPEFLKSPVWYSKMCCTSYGEGYISQTVAQVQLICLHKLDALQPCLHKLDLTCYHKLDSFQPYLHKLDYTCCHKLDSSFKLFQKIRSCLHKFNCKKLTADTSQTHSNHVCTSQTRPADTSQTHSNHVCTSQTV